MGRKIWKRAISWIACIVLVFLLVNLLCFGYKRSSWWLDTPNGASVGVREPHSILVNGTEGFSVSRIDKNGFLNPDKELADDYILVMGASHTFGKEVKHTKRYSELVNDYLGNDDYLHVYNIGMEGAFLPSQIKHFKAGVEAFDKAKLVTIEIGSTDFSIEELKDAVENQAEFDTKDTAEGFYILSKVQQAKKEVKSYLPLLSLVGNQREAFNKTKKSKTEYEVNTAEYSAVINDAMALMRSEYDKPIVFIYHPNLDIKSDGSIELKYSKTWDIFKEACLSNGIDLIDSGDDIIKRYNETHELPYGFSNTTMGDGHLNETGHEILATEIIEYLGKVEGE